MKWEPDLIDLELAEIKFKPKKGEIKKEFQENFFKKNEGKLIILLAILLVVIIIATMNFGGWDLLKQLVDSV